MDFNKVIDYVKLCLLEKYADFSGRASRGEYWSFALTASVITGVLNSLGRNSNVLSIIAYLVSLAVLLPNIAVAVRRLHDIGKKGTWYLLALIPIVGWVILIIWFCKEGDPGENEYGVNPLEVD
ncbi:MAG: DUF805 domain-containing protein [Candidatus Limivicinus sp.]